MYEEDLTPVERTIKYLEKEIKMNTLSEEEKQNIQATIDYFKRKVDNKMSKWKEFIVKAKEELERLNKELDTQKIKYTYLISDKRTYFIDVSVEVNISGKPSHGVGVVDILMLTDSFAVTTMKDEFQMYNIEDAIEKFFKELYSADTKKIYNDIENFYKNQQ